MCNNEVIRIENKCNSKPIESMFLINKNDINIKNNTFTLKRKYGKFNREIIRIK